MKHSLRFRLIAGVPGFHPGTLVVLAVLLTAMPLALQAGTHEVQRARKATAEVVRDGDDWVVSVDFIASHSLGSAKDVEVNRKLAQDYALRGLFRELRGKPDQDIVVSGFQTERSEEEDGRWKARFRVPSKGVAMRLKPPPEPPPEPNSEPVPAPESATAEANDASGDSTKAIAGDSGKDVPPRAKAPSLPSPPSLEVPDVKASSLPSPPPLEVPDVKAPSLPSPPPLEVPDVKAPSLPSPPPLEVPDVKAPSLPSPASAPSPSASPNPVLPRGKP